MKNKLNYKPDCCLGKIALGYSCGASLERQAFFQTSAKILWKHVHVLQKNVGNSFQESFLLICFQMKWPGHKTGEDGDCSRWLWRCLIQPPCSMQDQLKQVAQDCVQTPLEFLLGWRLHNLSWQPIALFTLLHNTQLFLTFRWNSMYFCPSCCF